MDNFKRQKTRPGRRTLDGFVSGNPTETNEGSIGFKRVHSYQPNSGRLDEFPKTEGFHPAVQGTVATSGPSSIGNEEALAPPLTPPKRRSRRARRKDARRANGRNWKKIAKRSALGLAVLLILMGGFLGWKVFRNTSKVFKGNIFGLLNSTKLQGEDKGRVNILLTGNSSDDPGHQGADLTDSIMILSIDTNNHTAFMMSIPRDLWVTYGPKNCWVGLQGKINATYTCGEQVKFHENGYPNGGIGLLTKVVEQNFGLDINYYTMINYTAFRDAVNAVGGIDVTIKSCDSRGLYDANISKHEGGPLKLTNGLHHLDGQTALNLARARGETVSYGFCESDFTRTEHQRQMLLALKDKVTSLGVLSNPAKISGLLDAAGNNVQTNFKTNEVRRLYDLSKLINNDHVQSIGLSDKNVSLVQTFTAVNGTSAVRPVAGVSDFSDIQAFVKRLTSNDPITREGATVVVLNGSGQTGLASQKADTLKNKGIVVKSVATTTVQPTTAIVALNGVSGKTSTKAYLEQSFGATTTTSASTYPIAKNYNADFVIILGQNAATGNQN